MFRRRKEERAYLDSLPKEDIKRAADAAITQMQSETLTRGEEIFTEIVGGGALGAVSAWAFGPLIGAGVGLFSASTVAGMNEMSRAEESLRQGKWLKAKVQRTIGLLELTAGYAALFAGIGGTVGTGAAGPLGTVPGAVVGAAIGLLGGGIMSTNVEMLVPVNRVRRNLLRARSARA